MDTIRFDPSNSRCRILTRRTGLLGAVGHDLELAATDYAIELDRDGTEPAGVVQLRARFAAESIQVVGAREHGELRADALSTRDQAEINRHVREDVLHSARFPAITFDSTTVERAGAGYRVTGRLALHGVQRELSFTVARRDDGLQAEVVLHQPDYGIKPFRALGGALRVHDDVVVQVWVPANAAG